MKAPLVQTARGSDGVFYMRSLLPMRAHGEVHASIPHLLEHRAGLHPDRNFIAERAPLSGGNTGDWRFITYGEINARSSAVGQALMDRGLGPDAPLLILSGSSISHAVMMLGAMKARVPVAPVSVAYSLMSGDYSKLRHVVQTVRPQMVFAEQGPLYARALAALPLAGVEVVSAVPAPNRTTTPYSELHDTRPRQAVKDAMRGITHDTVAKYLFTSGSTGAPKAVIHTQGMMCSAINSQESVRNVLRGLQENPQTLEWMPWNHITAGNFGFNNAMSMGGTVYLDAGKPLPNLFTETIRNLRDISPVTYSSAPIAFSWLADAMERDPKLRDRFFLNLEHVGYGGATLSQDIYERFQRLAIAATGMRIPFLTIYGATETHGVTMVHWPEERVGLLGLPMPGVELKLVPNGAKLEIRAKGPAVTPGYLNDPARTAAAFDEEGYYSLGDAATFRDETQPALGLVFDGRVAEDFKLTSGTWVSAGTLRAQAVAAASPLLLDCVVCGQDKGFVGLLAWVNVASARAICGKDQLAEILADASIREFIRKSLAAHNRAMPGSSTRIGRVVLMPDPPSLDANEITDKGYVNQRATLERRKSWVERLYAGGENVIEID